MNRLPISVCMISGAESQRIGRALESVAEWASEIVIVLNADVNDGTEEIARRHGAKIFREPWSGYVAQKSSAAQKATQDERLSALQEALSLPSSAQRIECFDVSHTMGEAAVASCVIFDRLAMQTGEYRRFNVKPPVGGDAISGVKIYNGTALLGSATLTSGTAASGTWTYTASGLVNGTYGFNAVGRDRLASLRKFWPSRGCTRPSSSALRKDRSASPASKKSGFPIANTRWCCRPIIRACTCCNRYATRRIDLQSRAIARGATRRAPRRHCRKSAGSARRGERRSSRISAG